MPYRIAVMTPPVPDDDADAWRALDAALGEAGPPGPDLARFLRRIRRSAQWPYVPDVDRASMTEFTEGNVVCHEVPRAIVLSVSGCWDFERELAALVDEAHRLGLVLLDAFEDRVHRPPA